MAVRRFDNEIYAPLCICYSRRKVYGFEPTIYSYCSIILVYAGQHQFIVHGISDVFFISLPWARNDWSGTSARNFLLYVARDCEFIELY